MKFNHHNNRAIKFFYFLLFTAAFSQTYAQLQINKHTINNGSNTTMTGGSYELKSSIGQVDAGQPSSGNDYSLNGGFWQQNNDLIFKNNFL